jgi:hypothetical protein
MTRPQRSSSPGRGIANFPGPVLVAAVAGLVLVASACGRGAPDAVARTGAISTTATAGPGGRPSQGSTVSGIQKYSACMRAHGIVGFPDPIVSGSTIRLQLPPGLGQGTPRFAAAQGACRGFLPVSQTQGTFTPGQQADYLKAAGCMRAHGIAGFPDPTFSGPGGVRFTLPVGMDDNSPQFEAARAICEKLIPQGLPYSN